jgi:hypothetical protein
MSVSVHCRYVRIALTAANDGVRQIAHAAHQARMPLPELSVRRHFSAGQQRARLALLRRGRAVRVRARATRGDAVRLHHLVCVGIRSNGDPLELSLGGP